MLIHSKLEAAHTLHTPAYSVLLLCTFIFLNSHTLTHLCALPFHSHTHFTHISPTYHMHSPFTHTQTLHALLHSLFTHSSHSLFIHSSHAISHSLFAFHIHLTYSSLALYMLITHSLTFLLPSLLLILQKQIKVKTLYNHCQIKFKRITTSYKESRITIVLQSFKLSSSQDYSQNNTNCKFIII